MCIRDSSNPAAVGAAATERELPIYYVQDNGEKRAALTFDAAWGNEDTEELIEILCRYYVKATFFLVGQWAVSYTHLCRPGCGSESPGLSATLGSPRPRRQRPPPAPRSGSASQNG